MYSEDDLSLPFEQVVEFGAQSMPPEPLVAPEALMAPEVPMIPPQENANE